MGAEESSMTAHIERLSPILGTLIAIGLVIAVIAS